MKKSDWVPLLFGTIFAVITWLIMIVIVSIIFHPESSWFNALAGLGGAVWGFVCVSLAFSWYDR